MLYTLIHKNHAIIIYLFKSIGIDDKTN